VLAMRSEFQPPLIQGTHVIHRPLVGHMRSPRAPSLALVGSVDGLDVFVVDAFVLADPVKSSPTLVVT
jgi:hypothetical protein